MTAPDLLTPIPLPDPVDEIRYERGDDEIETMILRSGRWFVKWPYTLTDCFVVRYVKVSLFRSKPIRVLSPELLEAKRQEMFGYAYGELNAATKDDDEASDNRDDHQNGEQHVFTTLMSGSRVRFYPPRQHPATARLREQQERLESLPESNDRDKALDWTRGQIARFEYGEDLAKRRFAREREEERL